MLSVAAHGCRPCPPLSPPLAPPTNSAMEAMEAMEDFLPIPACPMLPPSMSDIESRLGRPATSAPAHGRAQSAILNFQFSIPQSNCVSVTPCPPTSFTVFQPFSAFSSVFFFFSRRRPFHRPAPLTDQKMAFGCLRAKRLGLRQSSAAFATSPQGKAPGDWRTPRRCALTAARSVFMACGAACGMASGPKMRSSRRKEALTPFSLFVAPRSVP
jgi:hypothetical protein